MKRIVLTALLLTISSSTAYAQATVVINDTSKFVFTASADHNTLFAGTPVLTNYQIEFYLKTNPTGTGSPLFAPLIGKPAVVAGDIITANIKTLAPVQPNTEYIYFVRVVGPGGSNRSATSSDPFGFPGAPAATVGKPGIQ